MSMSDKDKQFQSPREKFLGLSLESTRKSYYPQLQQQLEAAEENERRLQLLIDNLPARIGFVNSEERYVTVNREYEKTFRIPRREIVGQRIVDVVGEQNYLRVKPYVDAALAGQLVQFETEFTVPVEGDQWHDFVFVPVRGGHKAVEGFYVLARDLTEKKRAEEEREKLEARLRDAQKFEAIGTLAGGIAHDFNNLLMAIQGRAALVGIDLEESHPHFEHIQAIEEYIRSATNLTKQLLGFARGGKYEVMPTDLNEILGNCAEMFGRTKKEVRVHKRFRKMALVAEVDRRQIEQVLLNMFVNAWQAMPEGGDLYLATTVSQVDEMMQSAHEIPPGRYARISVTDTGIGMSAEVRQRVFDPFFTTKDKGRGTGLGLASAYGIIKNHNGVITVYSEPHQGTTFNVYLPLSEKLPVHEALPMGRLVRGGETILLVDDEEIICDVGKAMLEALGYTVQVAVSGEQALDILAENDNQTDVVLLDLIMPGMDGGRTFDAIRKLRPKLPVILSSGYSLNGQADTIMKRGCNGFIQKPFNLSELSEAIHKALTGENADEEPSG